jgi:hypothetical protein
MAPTDPRTRDLVERLTALRMDAQQALLQTRLAIAATDQILRQTRAVLALPTITADELDRDPADAE